MKKGLLSIPTCQVKPNWTCGGITREESSWTLWSLNESLQEVHLALRIWVLSKRSILALNSYILQSR